MQDDLLVVGLDLETDREIHLREPDLDYWRARGYSGRRTLVCALCHAGIDAGLGTCVPLVVRGRQGGPRRPHFAHPPGQAPVGGHHPESVWHLSAKAVLADWARGQPGVIDVTVERLTPDRARRSDVRVRFRVGRQVALEVQATPLTDLEWSVRHADYQRQGITDVWLWRFGIRPHWIAASQRQSLWELDPSAQRAYLVLGAAHDRPPHWWAAEELHLFAQHEPPCVGDDLVREELDLNTIGLTAEGLVIPESIHREISAAHARVRNEAEQARAAMASRRQSRPAGSPGCRPIPRPTQQATSGPQPLPGTERRGLACTTCGLPLDPALVRIGRHILC